MSDSASLALPSLILDLAPATAFHAPMDTANTGIGYRAIDCLIGLGLAEADIGLVVRFGRPRPGPMPGWLEKRASCHGQQRHQGNGFHGFP